jgi:hypothetical protein
VRLLTWVRLLAANLGEVALGCCCWGEVAARLLRVRLLLICLVMIAARRCQC